MGEEVALEFAADVESAVASVRELADTATGLADAAKGAADGVGSITEPAVAAGDAIKGVADSSAAADGALGTTAGEARTAAGAYGELAAAAKGAADAQGGAATATEAAGTATAGAATKADTATAAAAGGGLGKYKTALLGIGIGAAVAVDGAVKYQAQTTRLVTSAGESANQLGMVRQGMLALSSQTDQSTAELSSGMYLVESAGYHGAAGLTVLKAAAQGAKDEGAQLSTVANGVTDALVDYHLPASAAATVTSQLVAAVSHGKTNFEAFSGSMSNVLPLASAMHLKLADVSGVLAEMTAHGMSADQASQDEANSMRELMKPNAAMVKEFNALHISSKQVYESLGTRGLAGTMQWLSGVAKDGAGAIGQNYTQAMGKLMGTAPGLVTALMTTGENANATNAAIKGIGSASADAQGNVDGFATVSQTASFKLGAAKNAAEAMGISLGEALLPAVTAIIGPITSFLELISSNRAATYAFAIVVGGILTVALGGKLVGAFKDVKEGVKVTGEGIGWLVGKLRGLGGASEATAAEEETAATESSGSWIAAFARQVAAGVAWAAQSVAKVAVVVASSIAGAAAAAASWVAGAAVQVASGVMWVAGTIAKVAVVVASNIAGAAVTAAAWIAANALMLLGIGLVVAAVVIAVVEIIKHWKTIVHAFDEVRHEIAVIFDGWRHDVSAAVDAAVGFFQRLPGRILKFLESLPGDMAKIGENIVHGLVNGIESMGSFLGNAIISLIPSPIRSLVSGALGILSPSTVFHGYGVNLVQGLINGVRAMQPDLHSAMSALTGGVATAGSSLATAGSSLAAGAIAPAGGSTSVHVTVPVTAQGMTPDYTSPQFQQYIQSVVQEGVLRYGQLNPGNGLTSAWGH